MSSYIDAAGRLHQDQEANLALTCPHCEVVSHVTPIAVLLDELEATGPSMSGPRIATPNQPILLRHQDVRQQPHRAGRAVHRGERPAEKFSYTYLPEDVETLFREALSCYSQACYNAFASMCRRAMQAAFADLGEAGKLRLFDQLNDVRVMAEIDGATFIDIKRVIFGSDNDPHPSLPMFDDQQSGVLLEVTKDLLYQVYVRKGRLQQAVMMRRFFADESLRNVQAAQPGVSPARPIHQGNE
jgi:hypothetical protein